MKLEDMDLRELLSFNPEGGVMSILGERVILMNASAMGYLRKQLVDKMGTSVAKCFFTHLGYANGWQTAKNIHLNISAEMWKESKGYTGSKIHSLTGQLGQHSNIRHDGEKGMPLIESAWEDCYEAEQHLVQLGLSDIAVCWTETGFASGYSSYVEGRAVVFVEDKCVGKGDASCHVTARFKEDWGPEFEGDLCFYNMESSFILCEGLQEELRKELLNTEKRLKKKKQQLSFMENDETASFVTGQSQAMRKTVDVAWRVAKVDSSVLITGESGVGKELMARFIHDQSARTGRAFVSVNCGALTETLLESELFGHAKGSFTGADKDRIGLFEAAIGGTLFLDEIGEVSPSMQVKLLRALQEREVRRVGENKPRHIDVRILSATNRNLLDEIAAGNFRQDLYYRLRVIELHVPPLRDRHEDILPIARFFLGKFNRNIKCSSMNFTIKAADQLLGYKWPGNVRELQNAVEHAVAMSQNCQIDVDDLPGELRTISLKPVVSEDIRPLDEIERDYILGVLHAVGDNKVQAAAQLNIGLATLYRKLKEYEQQETV